MVCLLKTSHSFTGSASEDELSCGIGAGVKGDWIDFKACSVLSSSCEVRRSRDRETFDE